MPLAEGFHPAGDALNHSVENLRCIIFHDLEHESSITDVEDHKKDRLWPTRVPMADTEKDRGELLIALILASDFSFARSISNYYFALT